MAASPPRLGNPFLPKEPGPEPLFAGRYRLDELLGVGSAGTVHRATDARTGATVALKRVAPELTGGVHASQLRERFRREALVLGRLNHPNTVRMYDYGELENNEYFLAMEYVAGGTLLNLLEHQESLAPHVAADLGIQLCAGMHEAHQLGVIHRDLKPENILLQPDSTRSSGYTVRVCDFNIAKLSPELVKRKLTKHGAILGTVLYMSPEQARGGKLDSSSDVYAIGCLLYEMLTGLPPFIGTLVEIIKAHTDSPMPRLERGDMDPDVWIQWQVLLDRATAKDPRDRPRTTEEMADFILEIHR